MSEFEVIGKRLPSVDARMKVTGQATYVTDIVLPKMLHGRILHSPHPHARLLNIDTSKARRLPGVKAVITAQDTAKALMGAPVADEPVLAIDRVRYIGDEIAAVAAVDVETAEEALSLIDVEYEILPAVFEVAQAMAPDAPLIHDAAGNIAHRQAFARGDVDAAFAEADYIFEDRFETHAQHQCYLEPNGCVASYDINGKLTLWAPLQNPFMVRPTIARAMGMDPGNIRIVQPYVGGAFGGAKTGFKVYSICGLLSRTTGLPVRLKHDRKEEFVAGRPRVPVSIELKLGVRRDGVLLAKQTRILADNGAYTLSAVSVISTTAQRADNLYHIPNLKTEALIVYTNKTPTGGFRGFGNPQMHFALESAIEEIADELGIDPAEMRKRNVVAAGDTTVHGWQIGSCGIRECIDQSVALSSWADRRPPNGRRYRGIGMAGCVHVSGNRSVYPFYDGSSAVVKIDEQGTIMLLSGEGDLGQGSRTVLAQIAAEELGVPLEAIESPPVDTDYSPFCLGSHASRVTTLGGNAVRTAAADAKRQILETAADMLECSPEDLTIKDSRIFVLGSPGRSITVRQAAAARVFRNGGAPVLGQGNFVAETTVMPDPSTKYGNLSTAYTFATQVAEVEIDADTGEIKLLNFVAAHDLGKAINPMLAEGQIEGGVAQGLGYALTEELIWQDGEMKNPNFHDYHNPLAADLPPIQIAFIESEEPLGPFGAKSVAEAAIIPTAAAVANAIYNATGLRIREIPINKERLWKALRGQESERLGSGPD